MNQIKNILNFVHQAEKLKSVLRHSWLSSGRRESVAEHSWRVALMAMTLHPYLQKKNRPNLEKVLKMVLVHDLPEIYAGDHFAWKGVKKGRHEAESKGLKKLLQFAPKGASKEVCRLWMEHEETKTKEAKFVRALDKLEALIQHDQAGVKKLNKKEFRLNLVYGLKDCEYDPILNELRQGLNKSFLKSYKKYKINIKLYK